MIIARGAEAVLRKENSALVKERVKKGYRIEQIDAKLRRSRTRRESALMREARRAGVLVPGITEEGSFIIKMEFISGKKVKDVLNGKNCGKICTAVSESIAKLHENDIIHGDLTTSNMLLDKKGLYFIDFGLGFRSKRAEDKAMDLYLLKEALESTHFLLLEKAWKIVLKVYGKNYSEAQQVFAALKKIEKRRRYTTKDN